MKKISRTLRVALTMRITQAPGYYEPRDSISHDWLGRLVAWGMTPVLIPNLLDGHRDYLEWASPDVLVLTGGDDLGKTPQRDEAEKELLEHALALGIPVLGVCRGLQLINARFGGKLEPVEGHVGRDHEITLARPWQKFYGPETDVNSYHTLGITPELLGEGLAGAAFDAGGHIEALHHRTLPLAAVMWHPERDGGNAADRSLLQSLAEGERFWA